MKFRDITNNSFGRLVAISFIGRRNDKNHWLCRCSCGKEVEVPLCNLTSGNTTSCGCFQRENIIRIKTTHGLAKTKFWETWNNMNRRCKDKRTEYYAIYGGRGIRVEWLTFEEFVKDEYASYLDHVQKFGERNTSIDRIDNDGPYSKLNCRWTTLREQQNNKRNNHKITFAGECLTISQWAEKTGLKPATILARIEYYGWPIDKALTKPPRRWGDRTNKRLTN